MKIAFIGPAYPLRGGIAQFICLLAEELQKRHEVKIFSFRRQYPRLIFPGKEQIDRSEQQPDLNIEAVVTPYNPLTWFAAVQKISEWQPDLIILKYWIPFFAPCYGWLIRHLKRRQKVKVVYLIDNIVFHEKWLWADKLSRYALQRADKLITMSDAVFRETKQLLPKAEVIRGFHPTYNCYNLNNFNKLSAQKKLNLVGKKVILFFGYIKPYKGLDLLIAAFPMILSKLPEAHLLIVGEVYGKDETYFQSIKELNLQSHVSFINRFVANEEVEIFYKAADVLALPYRSATQSGVVQIAYDFGLGAVCTPVGGLPELVIDGKTGIVAQDATAQAFAAATIKFFELNAEELQQNVLAENGKYTWQKFGELL